MGEGFTLLVVSLVLCGRVENHISRTETKLGLKPPPGDMPWPPKAAPAPVRGPSEDVYP